jgi:hypothetical protein
MGMLFRSKPERVKGEGKDRNRIVIVCSKVEESFIIQKFKASIFLQKYALILNSSDSFNAS